jgi:UDP-2,3-diacylglucosamine hydrolase
MDQRLFISDLHLAPEQPEMLELFLGFLSQRARAAAELYILGDLFDSWIGDDDDTAEYRQVIAALRQVVDSGTACWLMCGNRDFLLGRRFARASGCQLLTDPSRIQIADQWVLLMHGDLLCTDDVPYQRFRRRVRNPIVKRLFLLRSLRRRREIAANYRRRSREAMAAKQAAIMDVNQQAVVAYLRRYRAQRLIHGHTHRPGDHSILIDQAIRTRQVLADWRMDAGQAKAELLVEQNGRWWREPWPGEMLQ